MNYSEQLKKLLSLELNCTSEDFDKAENIITLPALNDGRRMYQAEPYFFHMVTLGKNAVITANEQLHGFLREWSSDCQGHWLFEQPNLLPLEKELNKYGYTLSQSHHMFLPKEHTNPTGSFETKWFKGAEIHQFYGDERFPNAICDKFKPERPDTLVVCAYIGGEIAGMAGCSEDAKGFQQIGIDVMPQFRSKGIGSYLVALLKNEIEKRGDIPFYGTSLSNLHSWNIALKCGFRPAWVEIGCKTISHERK
ncbi:MAG: GNAT family N-acetyltransferase [Ruminococcaceae bacterium]|nr:GNAT family N-acetyltransferase [Oscillospiraceae bacterium]